MQTAMNKSFVGAPLATRPQTAAPSRSRVQVVRAGKYDEELQQTAVSRSHISSDRCLRDCGRRLPSGSFCVHMVAQGCDLSGPAA